MVHRLRAWHRGMGALAALFLLMLAVTGILLNHTLDLKLAERHLDWPWLLEHYGVSEVEADRVYLLEDNVISQFDEQIFVDAQPVAKSLKPIIGGIYIDDITVVASDDALILLSSDGEFIEEMGGAIGIPSQIQNIGLFHGLPVLQTRHGMWRGDILLEQWEKISLQGVSWSEATSMPRMVKEDLARYFYGKGIPVERFVLDMHNGHILGPLGVWLLDFIGILLIVLSFSGLWIWSRTKT
ncbi:MAG: PepSY domain-containing protein [Gammaproteobacteria bacterium]|jgi:hypothetical protein|nr:PepSY domain-containing protein [Gammaproteobacteria bacterium]